MSLTWNSAVLCLALTACSTTHEAVHAAELVGTVIPPAPSGFILASAACVPGEGTPEHICDHSLQVLVKDGEPRYVVGTKRLPSGHGDRAPSFEVRDVVAFPKILKGFEFAYWGCEYAGHPDSAVAAIVRSTREDWFTEVLWVRRFDTVSEKLTVVKATQVKCVNAWGGLNVGDILRG